MRRIDLKSAAIEIHQAIVQGKRQKLPSPFFFMVGAGISHPPLALAAKIPDTCKEEAHGFGKVSPPGSDALIDSYSYWFEQAYPQPENRQLFLRELMENAFISRANFRLAHLLLEKTVTSLVVTTNFDDFLSRALTLFGRRHIVCDHPRTLERIDLLSQDVQIIHIHGSYWFYECCNLRGEISERAKDSAATSFTRLSMLDDILRTHTPLVVGYSGWEGDVFMTALERRMAVREQVAKAMVNKAYRLAALNRIEGAIGVYDEVVRRFGDAPEPALREQIAMALVNKGDLLATLKRREDAIGVYDEVVRRFGDATEPAVRKLVAQATAARGK